VFSKNYIFELNITGGALRETLPGSREDVFFTWTEVSIPTGLYQWTGGWGGASKLSSAVFSVDQPL
jgi:hypothetical protein